MQNYIDGELSDEQRAAIDAAIKSIRENIEYLRSIAAGQRRRLRRMGLDSRGYVEAANAAVHQFPDVLPPAFDVAAFDRDLALLRSFEPVVLAVDALNRDVQDTWVLLGSDAMKASDTGYHYLNGHANVDQQSAAMQVLRQRYDAQRGPRRKKGDSAAA